MSDFDVVIVGASFSGLTLAHHLPSHLRVLIVEVKPTAGATVESTGLITSRTREELRSFFDIDAYITNAITSICVVAPNFKDHFVSTTTSPWIYQTDTKGFVHCLAETLPQNVELRTATAFMGMLEEQGLTHVRLRSATGEERTVSTRFVVGADGGRSSVARAVPGLDRNERFLFGYERVYFGDVHLGPKPEETIYHFWFGEFSLGYGGWLSPTVVNGRRAFRIGLAKHMKDRGEASGLMEQFLHELQSNGTITIDADAQSPDYVFGSMIPIGGVRRRVSMRNVLLIGDAAGFCGAFAADGIKGSVVSGKEAAQLIPRYLNGERDVLEHFLLSIDQHDSLIHYYRRQMRYRWIWDRMRRNRTFTAMYRIIEKEKGSFLDQFCDSKDKHTSLVWTVLKWRYVPQLAWYSVLILIDLLPV